MKRSEMCEKLLDIIYNIDNIDISACPFDFEKDILTKLEELGMAPPEVAEPVKTSVLVATPHGYVEQRSEDSKVFVRKWESEDE